MHITKPWITVEDRAAVDLALASGQLMSGNRVAIFEDELRKVLKREYVVCVSSGSAALLLAFMARHQLYGHRVNRWRQPIAAFGFIGTAQAAMLAGEHLVFMDSKASVLGVMNRSVYVDRPPMEDYRIHDVCQAFGEETPHSLADCYSFNANKIITTGGGGCIATNDKKLADLLQQMRAQGRDSLTTLSHHMGGNFRMSEMSAALGLSQLSRLDTILELRQTIAGWYQQYIPAQLAADWQPRKSWFMFPIHVEHPSLACKFLADHGIASRPCIDWCIPRHPVFNPMSQPIYSPEDYPYATWLAEHTLLLPIYPELTLPEVRSVGKVLQQFCLEVGDAEPKTQPPTPGRREVMLAPLAANREGV